MNLAVPPFDDVHVRPAVNLAVGRDALKAAWESLRLRRAPALTFEAATHIAPDGEEEGLLASFGQASTSGRGERIELAREEMAHSPYDEDGDGRCDGAACGLVSAVGLACGGRPLPEKWPQGRIIRRDLSRIGIFFGADPKRCPPIASAGLDPEAHVPITSDA